jgi:hypothetical protein
MVVSSRKIFPSSKHGFIIGFDQSVIWQTISAINESNSEKPYFHFITVQIL